MSESPCHDPLGLDRRAKIDVEVTMAITICLAATFIIWHWLIYFACTGNYRHAILDSEPVYGNLEFRGVGCPVTGSVMFIVAYASLFTLALIAFNRQIKVLKRSLYRKVFPQKRAARLYRVLVWMVAICLFILLLGG